MGVGVSTGAGVDAVAEISAMGVAAAATLVGGDCMSESATGAGADGAVVEDLSASCEGVAAFTGELPGFGGRDG